MINIVGNLLEDNRCITHQKLTASYCVKLPWVKSRDNKENIEIEEDTLCTNDPVEYDED